MPNTKKAQDILDKHGINVKIAIKDLSNVSLRTYQEITKLNDPLSELEHLVLFDTFWSLGNESKGLKVPISDGLKLKLVANRAKIDDYFLLSIGMLEDIFKNCLHVCYFSKSEEKEFWSIFHKLYPELSARSADKINYRIGIYKVIEQKIKWWGKTRVLDLGCGKNANGISQLVERYEGKIKGFGVDLAIGEHPPNVRVYKADIKKLPFKSNLFDVVYSVGVIGYSKDSDIVDITKEALRVLKPKGIFVFFDYRPKLKYQNEIIPQTGTKAKVFHYSRGSRLIIKY